ncbi:hypothetical protein ACIHFE_03860 [Streptomyces sp. NPDC052396]|uniref:hypothetical protein n=1 Tax=Streptomyces sp. NPDC052396 TaxID=3365689 RepID=UPI0037D6156F
MNGTSTALILVGLFLVGGIISFLKQGMPKSVIVLLGISAVLCLAAGALRIKGLWA